MNIDEKIALAGVIVSAFGFAVLIFQLFHGLRLMRSEKIARIYSELHQVHHAFVEYPELRPFFFHKVSLSSPPEGDHTSDDALLYYRARAIAEMFFDVFEHIFILKAETKSPILDDLTQAPTNIDESFEAYIQNTLSGSEFISAYMMEVNDSTYPEGLARLVRVTVLREWPEVFAQYRNNGNA